MGFFPHIPELVYLQWYQDRLRKVRRDYHTRQVSGWDPPLHLKLRTIIRARWERNRVQIQGRSTIEPRRAI